MLDAFWQDLRYAVRMLRKSPTFTLVAVAVIALGSGAVTTIFSAANATLLRPIPGVVDPHRLVDIARTMESGRGSLTPSYPFYGHLRDESRTLNGVAAWTFVSLTVSTGAEGTAAFGTMVSNTYFSVLGVRPALGRFFTPGERETPGTPADVVLSHGFWQRQFGGDSSIVGRSMLVNGTPYTVIGVTPADFAGVYPVVRTDVWVPLTMAGELGEDPGILASAGSGWLTLVGRLRSGVSIEQARTDLAAIAAAHLDEEPADFKRFTGIAISRLTGFPADATGALYGFVALLFAASALVLIIASVNVASMLLARASTRRREMAVRVALGAGRGRLVRQLVTESVLLFVVGALGGLGIALWGARLFERVQLPAEVPIGMNLSPDYRVLAFALATALVTGVLFGLAPALQATRADPNISLRSDTAGSGSRRSRMRSLLVVGQMALSLLLLMSAGLFVRSLDRGERVDPGFERRHVATAPLDPRASGYSESRARQFYDDLKQRLLASPEVRAVSYARLVPLAGGNAGTRVRVDGYQAPDNPAHDGTADVDFNVVAPDYFDVLQIPLLQGRGFLATDDSASARVAVVNETFVHKFWPAGDPIGRTFHDDSATVTVIGVARDAKYSTLYGETPPFVYWPAAQRGGMGTLNLLVRTGRDDAALIPVIRSAVHAIDPLLPAPPTLSLEAATSVSLLPQRVAAAVTAVMGLLGLILSAVGLYGVVAYTASQRTREIGVRMALGANRRSVLGLIMHDGMRLVAVGIGIGLLLAALLTRAMSHFLFGVSPLDPLVFALIPLALALVALVANYLPARRAASTDPVEALRAE